MAQRPRRRYNVANLVQHLNTATSAVKAVTGAYAVTAPLYRSVRDRYYARTKMPKRARSYVGAGPAGPARNVRRRLRRARVYGRPVRKELKSTIQHANTATLAINADVAAVTPLTAMISTVQQGPNYNERIGNQIKVHRIQGNVTVQANGTPTNIVWRYLIVRFIENLSATPTDIQPNVLVTADASSLATWVEKSKAQILFDRRGAFSAGGNDWSKHFKVNVKVNRLIKFTGATSGIGDIASGSIYHFFFSSGSISLPNITHRTRMTFEDA